MCERSVSASVSSSTLCDLELVNILFIQEGDVTGLLYLLSVNFDLPIYHNYCFIFNRSKDTN